MMPTVMMATARRPSPSHKHLHSDTLMTYSSSVALRKEIIFSSSQTKNRRSLSNNRSRTTTTASVRVKGVNQAINLTNK